MSKIIKTEAIVLSKINYGDTSKIVSIYTKEHGKMSAIVKGARSSKSKIGLQVDPINYLQLVIYLKEEREVQLISNVDVLNHFPQIKEDFEKIQYSYAILELIKNLTHENDSNEKLFRAVVRILELINEGKEFPNILFARFLIFFLKEIGFDLQIEKCSICGKKDFTGEVILNFGMGIFCQECSEKHLKSAILTKEQFQLLSCLKTRKNIPLELNQLIPKIIKLLENYLKFHLPDFKGIQSLKLN